MSVSSYITVTPEVLALRKAKFVELGLNIYLETDRRLYEMALMQQRAIGLVAVQGLIETLASPAA